MKQRSVYCDMYPCCLCCGNYTNYNEETGVVLCTCGWSIDADGNESFAQDDLSMYEEEKK